MWIELPLKHGYTLWRGMSEGYRVYSVTRNHEGKPVLPSGKNLFYSRIAAVQAYKQAVALDFAVLRALSSCSRTTRTHAHTVFQRLSDKKESTVTSTEGESLRQAQTQKGNIRL